MSDEIETNGVSEGDAEIQATTMSISFTRTSTTTARYTASGLTSGYNYEVQVYDEVTGEWWAKDSFTAAGTTKTGTVPLGSNIQYSGRIKDLNTDATASATIPAYGSATVYDTVTVKLKCGTGIASYRVDYQTSSGAAASKTINSKNYVQFEARKGVGATLAGGSAAGIAYEDGYGGVKWHYNKSDGSWTETTSPDYALNTSYDREGYFEATTYTPPSPTTYTFTVRVQFSANGGSGAPEAQTKSDTGSGSSMNITVPIPSMTPTRAGYTFLYWYCADTGVYYTPGVSYEFPATAPNGTTSYTLSAIWAGNTYYVAFNANGGTGTMNAQTFTYGEAQYLTANAFTRSGYDFLGWALSSTATTAAYSDQAYVSNLTTTAYGTVTLYAVWQKKAGGYVKIKSGGVWGTYMVWIKNGGVWSEYAAKIKDDESWKETGG